MSCLSSALFKNFGKDGALFERTSYFLKFVVLYQKKETMARITIPYAVADFVEMRERNFYYVDKTDFIPGLEDYKAPVFLRPRRFGKSLFISTLACYYDRTKADRFEELFGGTWIGEHRRRSIIVI